MKNLYRKFVGDRTDRGLFIFTVALMSAGIAAAVAATVGILPTGDPGEKMAAVFAWYLLCADTTIVGAIILACLFHANKKVEEDLKRLRQ